MDGGWWDFGVGVALRGHGNVRGWSDYFMKLFFWIGALWLAVAAQAVAQSEMDGQLKRLVERQKALLERADGMGSAEELEDLRAPFQKLVFDYEDFVRKNPDLAAGHVSFAMLLAHPVLDERKRATQLLLRANQIDPDLPLVKNQLGNYLAEEGKPLDALNYYLAAVRLAPDEPLYHFQIGNLLVEGRDAFLESEAWTRATLDGAMMEAFEKAKALAPERFDLAYRHAMAFYDLAEPRWDDALAAWRALDERAETSVEREALRLHVANVLIKQGRADEARALIETVKEPALAKQRAKLERELAER